MKKTGVQILKYTGIVLMVLSLVEIVFELLYVMHFDILGLASGEGAANLFYSKAGGFGVQLLFSVVGVAAAYVAIALAEDERFNSYLRLFGVALIIIYVIEGCIIMSQADLFSWIRLIVLLVLSALYIWGACLLKKEDAQEEKSLEK